MPAQPVPRKAAAAAAARACTVLFAASRFATPVSAARSAGCASGGGGTVPLVPGNCVAMSINMGYATREYTLCLPSSYALSSDGSNASFPLVLNFHGWGGTMEGDLGEAQVWNAVEEPGATPAVVVHPQGYADHDGRTANWGSWHINGTAESPGPEGPTCTPEGGTTRYCYNSCKKADANGGSSCDPDGCDWTTCVDDYAFVSALLDALEQSLCIDTAREYATGCSNGGMMAYGLGANLATRFAAVAPQCGSFHNGFLDRPDAAVGMPLMDVHGDADTVVPANLTLYNTPATSEQFPLSADGWCVHACVRACRARVLA
jgi:poly(3-hydroxybutyrate) depolymerase